MQNIIRYYEETWLDYRALWTDNRSRAMHFGYYDQSTTSHANALLNTNATLADLVELKPGERLLDAGCGVGGTSCWLAEERNAKCVGITPVIKQVVKAQNLALARNLQNDTQFICADFTQQPFDAGSFDVVWALESLCHAEEKKAFYREAGRSLRPGGRLVLAEYMRCQRPAAGNGEELLSRWCSGWAMPDLDSVDEHIAAAESAGFSDVKIQDFTPIVRRSLYRLYKLTRIAEPLDKLLYALGLRSDVQHGNVVASRLQYKAIRENHWIYGVLTATRQ